MNPAFDIIKHAAELAKRMGSASLPNGKTLSEMFVIDGVSLWDVAAPVLAVFYLANDLLRKTPQSFFLRRIKPCLSRTKSRLRSLIPFSRSSNGCLRWPEEPVFLFLGFSGYMYRDVLELVAYCLKKKHGMNYVALHDGGSFQGTTVKLQGDGVHSVWEHWDSRVRADELKIRRQLAAANGYLKTLKTLPDLISDPEGESLWLKVEMSFKWCWSVYLPSLAPYLALTRHILREHRPALIVSPDVADPRTRLFCLAGRLLGIPSLEIQFGLYGKDSVEWQFCVADRVAVWGEQARNVLSGQGVPDNRIILTGSPRFDSLANMDAVRIAATRSRLGIADGRTMVLFASQYSLTHYSEYCNYRSAPVVKRAIFEAADRIEGLCLVVKPHPLENVRETKKTAKGCKNIVFVKRSEDIRELTKACDVFITFGSTATMDALIARKLVIFPAFPGLVWWDDMYLKNNVAVVVKSAEELERKLKEAIGGQRERLLDELEPARRCFLKELVHQADGQAANRIAALAMQMAGMKAREVNRRS